APLQVYGSALLFSPRGHLYSDLPLWIKRISSTPKDNWGSLMKSLNVDSTVTSVSFSPDGKLIASGSWDKTVRVWDVVTGTSTATFEGHSNVVISVTFSPDGKLIASGSHDKTVRVWDAVTGTSIATFKGHSEYVTSVTFSPD